MRYLFCFKVPDGAVHGQGGSEERVLDWLHRAIETVGSASKATEVATNGATFVEVMTDETDAAAFEACAPMTYCVEVLPEYEP